MVGSRSDVGDGKISGFILGTFSNCLPADEEALFMEGDGFGGVGAPSSASSSSESSVLSKSFSTKLGRFLHGLGGTGYGYLH